MADQIVKNAPAEEDTSVWHYKQLTEGMPWLSQVNIEAGYIFFCSSLHLAEGIL